MKIPVFLPVTREFGFRDEFAQDCLLQRRVRKPSVPREKSGSLLLRGEEDEKRASIRPYATLRQAPVPRTAGNSTMA